MTDTAIQDLANRIRTAGRPTVLTGAGVSAASGVPTFRGAHGLWRTHRAEELATPEAFAANPRLVWEWYDWRRQLIAGCQPNRAHEVLAAWSRRYAGLTLITQNVDGLHERAGTRNVLRFHGSIWDVRCWDRCSGAPRPWRDERLTHTELPVRCPHCGGLARPDVVWFGEALDPRILAAAFAAARCDVFLSIGTSSVVQPAASLVYEARRHGAFTAEINLEATPLAGELDLQLQGPAEVLLDAMERHLTTQ